MAKISKALVTLRFFGEDLEPEELTRLLGAQPSRARRKGDRQTLSNGETRVAGYGSWFFGYSQESSPVEIDEQLNSLLDKLTDDVAVWLDLTTRYDGDISCGLFLDGWNEGFSLTESTLKRLSERNLSIGFDIYAPADTGAKEQEDGPREGTG